MTVPAERTTGGSPAARGTHFSAPTRRRQAALVSVVVLSILVPTGWRTWSRLHGVYDGVFTSPTSGRGWSDGITVARVRSPASGLIRPGDRIVAVDGMGISTWASHSPTRPATERRPGDAVRYSLLRDREALEAEVVLRRSGFRDVLDAEASTAPLVLCAIAVAGFVFVRRPRDRAARVLLLIAALVAAGAAVSPFLQVIDLAGGRGIWPFVSDRIARALMWGAMLHLALVFPERASGAWGRRWMIALAYAGPFLLYGVYLAATLPGATTHLERLGRLVSVSRLASYTYPLVVVATMGLRYRSLARGASRRRLKWVLVTLSVSSALYLALGELPGTDSRGVIRADLLPLVFLPYPIAIGVAILRYRLFEVEVILKRSLVYGGLTAGVLVLYLLSVEVLERLFGGNRGLPLLVSGLVAACVPGLRRWLQAQVGRLIYGERDDPEEVIARLGQRLEATSDPQAVLPGLVETLAQTLRLSYAAVEVASSGEVLARASYGAPAGEVLNLRLVHRGEHVGELSLAVRAGAEPFGPADQRLLEHIRRQTAVTANGVALFAALQRSLERTVTAREEERRRLRRDLHDGLGPTLAATALQLRVARSLVGKDPASAKALMERLAGHVQTATADVRRIVDDLRPADLDQLGLVGAIQQRAAYFGHRGDGSGHAGVLDVRVETEGPVESLPAAVEVAVFSIVVEALNNASRHGGASVCTVGLRANDVLELTVRDNGSGLPATVVEGVGTASMRERAAELGGTCEIRRGEGGGTVVEAWFPLRAEGRVDGTATGSDRR